MWILNKLKGFVLLEITQTGNANTDSPANDRGRNNYCSGPGLADSLGIKATNSSMEWGEVDVSDHLDDWY